MTNRSADTSQRKTAIIVGVLILIAYGTVGSLILESLIIVMILELISGAAVVGAAVLMFPILKPHNKNLTFGYTAIMIIEGVLIIVASIILLPLIIKAETSSTLLLESRDWIYVIIGYLFGIRFLLISYLLYQSKLVPRFISVWGFVASIMMITATLINMMADSTIIPFIFSHLPLISNEIFLAIWFIVKGFNEDAIMSGVVKTDINNV